MTPAERYAVRDIEATDREAWLGMWRAYCDFYEVSIPEATTEATWRRVLDPGVPIHALVAVDVATNETVGFANYVVHPYTWSERPACYLEDLFVRPSVRGGGAGGALIGQLIARARQRDWARVYWMTREDNAVARRLYDRFCERDDFVRYALEIEG
jgi:GNAT superfamily N-acetyltransferase